jgi:hypothetical protein
LDGVQLTLPQRRFPKSAPTNLNSLTWSPLASASVHLPFARGPSDNIDSQTLPFGRVDLPK